MHIEREDLQQAARQGLLQPDQVDALWDYLAAHAVAQASATADAPVVPRFTAINVLYYAGALVVIAAMGILMGLGWESFGGKGIACIAAIYALIFGYAGLSLWRRPDTRIPAGLLCTMSVCMMPLLVYGIERHLGFWPQGDPGDYHNFYPYVRGSWIVMELVTILAALLMLRKVPFGFLTAPAAFAMWFLSMDLVPMLMGTTQATWEQREWSSVVFGAAMLILGVGIDRRTRVDFSFWLYLFGLLAFCGGIYGLPDGSELGRAVVAAIYLLLMVASVLLDRRAFLVFGGLGVFAYLGHLAHVVFEYSLLFPFVLTAIGLAMIYLGIVYQRHKPVFDAALHAAIPAGLQRILPSARQRPR